MPVSLSLSLSPSTSAFLLLVLGFLALLVVDVLIALIEGVTLTLLRWNPFRQSLTISVIMNLISGIFNASPADPAPAQPDLLAACLLSYLPADRDIHHDLLQAPGYSPEQPLRSAR